MLSVLLNYRQKVVNERCRILAQLKPALAYSYGNWGCSWMNSQLKYPTNKIPTNLTGTAP